MELPARRGLLSVLFLFISVTTTITSTVAAESDLERHRNAARELLQLIDMEQTMVGTASAMADVMVQQNPLMAPYQDVLVKWSANVMTWERFEPKLVEIYIEAFSETELRELIVFYQTPTGRKAIQLLPELTRKGALLGSEVASQYAPELQQMIEARTAELEQTEATE